MALISQISNATDLSTLSGLKVSSPSSSATDTASTSTAAPTAKDLKDRFLKILLTQMQHQNPIDPMDTKEFTGQLTQFSALEQQIESNSKLDSLLASLKQSAVSSAFNYIGQYVDIKTDTTSLQNGSANWTYSIPKTAKSVQIKVTDTSGNILYEKAMENGGGGSEISAGTYSLKLDSADLTKAQKDGTALKFTMTAMDSDGATVTPTIHTTVKVESLQSDSTGAYLQAGGILFALGDIQKIIGPNLPTTSTQAA